MSELLWRQVVGVTCCLALALAVIRTQVVSCWVESVVDDSGGREVVALGRRLGTMMEMERHHFRLAGWLQAPIPGRWYRFTVCGLRGNAPRLIVAQKTFR